MILIALLFLKLNFIEANNFSTEEIHLEDRIINGRPVRIEEYPHLAFVSTHCGGAILSPKWVVTAAHCVYSTPVESLSVTAGLTYQSELRSQSNLIQTTPVEVKISHPGYTEILIDDLALLKVKIPFQFNSKVKALGFDSIMNYNEDEYEIFRDFKLCQIAGWGYTCQPGDPTIGKTPEQLQATELPLVDSRECLDNGLLGKPGANTRGFLCYRSPDKSFWGGDSGSPLLCKGTLVGVVSFGWNDCVPNKRKEGVFTRLDTYKQWIMDTIHQHGVD